MGSAISRIKDLVSGLIAWATALPKRWAWLGRLLATLSRYGDRRGNTYAAAIAFNGIVSMVPILMVGFAIFGFVLANNPGLLKDVIGRVTSSIDGELGDQVSDIIATAVDSWTTVGLLGLGGAVLTGAGWMAVVRMGLTEMWGGRVKQNAILAKVWDVVLFFGLGLVFLLTLGLSAVGSGPIAVRLVRDMRLDDVGLGRLSLQTIAHTMSIVALWMLFCFILARLPYHKVPFRAVAPAALVTALVFEALKTVGGYYLENVLSSPAGVAFGPVLGIMVFAYLASRILLYAAAWGATRPGNEKYWVEDEIEPTEVVRDVVLAPVYDVRPAPSPKELATAAGIGAAAGAALAWLRRRR